jgi:hypothetical protein
MRTQCSYPLTWWMSGENKSSSERKSAVSPRRIGLYFTLLAFFGPAFALIYWFPTIYPSFQIWGMVWWFYYSLDYGGWYLDYYWFFYIIAHSVLYTFLRPAFVYQMVRLYQGKSTKKQTLLVGLFVELQPLIIDVPEILIDEHAFYSIHLPIPLLLLAGIIVMRYKSFPTRTKSWLVDEQTSSNWWGSEKKDDAKTRFLKGVTINKVLETILIAEIILLIFGGLIVTMFYPWQYQVFYGEALPIYILITGLLFLMTRPVKTE